jgi:hypothetical protein
LSEDPEAPDDPDEEPEPDDEPAEEPEPEEESGDEDWRSRISVDARSGSGWPRAVRRRSGMW